MSLLDFIHPLNNLGGSYNQLFAIFLTTNSPLIVLDCILIIAKIQEVV